MLFRLNLNFKWKPPIIWFSRSTSNFSESAMELPKSCTKLQKCSYDHLIFIMWITTTGKILYWNRGQVPVSISNKTSYHKISWSLGAMRFVFEIVNRSEIWQAPQQHCCWGTCQISKWCDNSNYQSYGFETHLLIRRLIEYWNGDQGQNQCKDAILQV